MYEALFGAAPLTWDLALPFIFAALMGVSILVYVVLDGFDLGVGVLSPLVGEEERDTMVASIGPFWDANETWLVLAVGILLTAFPTAHGQILTALYLPATFMLIGLILRGVAFEFRAKAPIERKARWDRVFFIGSLLASLTQGYMLGVYILGLDQSLAGVFFGLLTGVCLTAGYALIGATWLIAKTEGALQKKSVLWARVLLWGAVAGMAAISLASPLASDRLFEKWLAWPALLYLAPLPILTGLAFLGLFRSLQRAASAPEQTVWRPFVLTVALYVLGFCGMAYSFYPYIVPEQTTLYEAAAATGSLAIILVGALITLPMIVAYSIYAYWVFGGKATKLTYE